MSYSGKLYINGKWITGGGEVFSSLNPATGEVIWKGNAAKQPDVNAAVEAARTAFEEWGWLSMEERLTVIKKFQSIIEARKDELAEILAQETGKILWDAKSEITAMINKLGFALQAYNERTGIKTTHSAAGNTSLHHKPHGVIAVYGPYNFPAHLPNGHIIPALLAGNTIVFKPSGLTPFVAEKAVECWDQAGLPKGVLNLIQGEGEAGKLLSAHPELDGLFFTGSSTVGTLLNKQFSATPNKILALEMGGNNPLIVHDVADAKAAAYLTIQSAYLSSGQRCTCARRLIVPQDAGNDLYIKALIEMVQTIKVGSYKDSPEPFMGPLISNKEAENLLAGQDQLEKAGGKVLVRMKRLRDNLPFLSPALIDTTAVNRSDTEWFGPLLQLIRVNDLETAIAEANNTQYGLSSGIFTDKRENFELFLKKIRAGIANWNKPLTGSGGNLPFGGVGMSGNNRPAAYYSADYCAYPIASNELEKPVMPAQLTPGVG